MKQIKVIPYNVKMRFNSLLILSSWYTSSQYIKKGEETICFNLHREFHDAVLIVKEVQEN